MIKQACAILKYIQIQNSMSAAFYLAYMFQSRTLAPLLSSTILRGDLKRASVPVHTSLERQAMECGSAKVPGGSQAELQHEGAGVGDAPEGRSGRARGDRQGQGGAGVRREGLLAGRRCFANSRKPS